MCSVAQTLRDFLEGRSQWQDTSFQNMLTNQQLYYAILSLEHENLIHRLEWRLQDLRDSGGLGFTVELFFITLKRLLSISSSTESHSALFIGTFRSITSDWKKYKHCLGTQKILLHSVVTFHGIMLDFSYPAYIEDELLELLRNVLEGQTGPHIDDVVRKLRHS
jgi:hypothetical protein